MLQPGTCSDLMDNGGHKYDKEPIDTDSCHDSVHSWNLDDCDGDAMSRESEIINIDTMIGRTLIDGKVVAEYKVENCDNCQKIRTLDQGGYQRNIGGEPIMWFCVECRK